jgi:RNA polymerase sigma-70 factor (ECF subfamily)
MSVRGRAGLVSDRMEQDKRAGIVAWVAHCVMPHEGKVRAWLARSRVAQEDIDDVIQEAYCRLSALEDVGAIDRPDAYFFSIARNLLAANLRRARIVRIEAVAEIEALAPFDDAPSPERQAAGRIELARVAELVARLPERCRRIFELRKIQGLPQRDIAAQLGVTESIVENEGARGVRLVLAQLRAGEENNIALLEQGAGKGVRS